MYPTRAVVPVLPLLKRILPPRALGRFWLMGWCTACTWALATPATDCRESQCAEIVINGDAPQSSLFHGYADPSIRQDPDSGDLLMAYAWPHRSGNGHAVDLHLARSRDTGRSWQFAGVLQASAAVSASRLSSAEVPNLLALPQTMGTRWVYAHESYFAPSAGAIYDQLVATGHVVLRATTAAAGESASDALLRADTTQEARLGTGLLESTRLATTDLTRLHTSLTNCLSFGEPALAHNNGQLLLALVCRPGDPKTRRFYGPWFGAMFATDPSALTPAQWTWRHVGNFALPQDAQQLGAQEGDSRYRFLTQLDFARDREGAWLLVTTPAAYSEQGDQLHYGCRLLRMDSLDPPVLSRSSTGELLVAARVDATDLLDGDIGPGACTYEPASDHGVVMVRKRTHDARQGFVVSLHASHTEPRMARQCLFTWAERTFSALFAPTGAPTLSAEGYVFRYYRDTNTYLGISEVDNHLRYLGADGVLGDAGNASTWLVSADCL